MIVRLFAVVVVVMFSDDRSSVFWAIKGDQVVNVTVLPVTNFNVDGGGDIGVVVSAAEHRLPLLALTSQRR